MDIVLLLESAGVVAEAHISLQLYSKILVNITSSSTLFFSQKCASQSRRTMLSIATEKNVSTVHWMAVLFKMTYISKAQKRKKQLSVINDCHGNDLS